jgi:arylsulfatase A
MKSFDLTAFIFFSLFAIQIVSSESDKPNIIFMLADDMGYGDLGLNGNK